MKIKKHIILSSLFIGAALLSLLYIARYPQFFFGKKGQTVVVVGVLSRNVFIPVELARDPYAWSRGLMFRETLDKDSGMLFVFPDATGRSFWMKNTLIPLDMIFISKDKMIVTIHKNVQPCTTTLCPGYASTADAMYVLEVNGGFADTYGLTEGDVVEITIQ